MFTPPLYKQRYQFVMEFVEKQKPKKVIDLGCADCRLLKKLRFCHDIELLVGVDINNSAMSKKKHCLAPFPGEYLQPGDHSLTIELFQGSVTDEEPHTKGFDLATCIELIEHLHLPEVERFSQVLFGYMAPSAVIISTPNVEFNSLLPGRPKLRNSDHKFEWTQAEFRSWASEICGLHGYLVEHTGVGKVTSQAEHLGFCSQIGVFIRKPYRPKTPPRSMLTEDAHVYKLIYRVEYPTLKNNNIFQRTLVNEVLYWAEHVKQQWLGAAEMNEGLQSGDVSALPAGCEGPHLEPYLYGCFLCVPLAMVMSFPSVRKLSGSVERVRDVLLDDPRTRLIGDTLALDLNEEDPSGEQEEPDNAAGADCADSRNVLAAGTFQEDWEAQMRVSGEGSGVESRGVYKGSAGRESCWK